MSERASERAIAADELDIIIVESVSSEAAKWFKAASNLSIRNLSTVRLFTLVE